MAKRIKTELVVEGKNNASRALKQADSQLLGISSAAKKAGAALLGAFSVAAIGSWVNQSIAAADESRKLAQSVGLTTEKFTGLQFAAAQSGVSTQGLTASMTRLNRSLSDAATIGGRPAEIFERIGVSVLNADGGLRAADSVLADIAERFQSMPDGAEKSAIAVELLGRSGAQLIPLLNGGAEGIAALTAQAERLGLVISDEQAAQSERYNDTIAALGAASRGAANTVAGELLPTLNEMSGLLLDLVEDGDSAKIMAQVLSFAMKSLASAVIAVGSTFGNLGRLIGATAAAAVAAARGDFSEAGQIFRDVTADNEQAARDAEERIKKIWDGGFADSGSALAETRKNLSLLEQEAAQSAERWNKAFANSYKDMVRDSKAALSELVRTEKATQKEIEDIRKKRLDIEKRYAEAIAGFGRTGTVEPSYNQAQDLKIAARAALQAGDAERAAKLAQESLKVLQDLSDSGESTFGFAGFAKELQAIELASNDIEKSQADKKLEEIRAQIKSLRTEIDELTAFDIELELTDATKQKIIKEMEDLRKLLGQPVSIQAQLDAAAAPPAFASGGKISGPGTGTSDSVLIRASNGEYMIKAAAVRKYGTSLLDNINGMRLPKYADGGLIGAATAGAGSRTSIDFSFAGSTYDLSGPSDTIEELARAVQLQKLKRR